MADIPQPENKTDAAGLPVAPARESGVGSPETPDAMDAMAVIENGKVLEKKLDGSPSMGILPFGESRPRELAAELPIEIFDVRDEELQRLKEKYNLTLPDNLAALKLYRVLEKTAVAETPESTPDDTPEIAAEGSPPPSQEIPPEASVKTASAPPVPDNISNLTTDEPGRRIDDLTSFIKQSIENPGSAHKTSEEAARAHRASQDRRRQIEA